jgi:hypothetical protein
VKTGYKDDEGTDNEVFWQVLSAAARDVSLMRRIDSKGFLIFTGGKE